jgi:hypothetical protein
LQHGAPGDERALQPSVSHFLYLRHFACLTCFSVLLGLTAHLPLAANVPLSFALYGGLHAAALSFAQRARQPPWQMALFIGAAAALSMLTLRTGLIALQLLGSNLPGNSRLNAALGFAAMMGALAYGILIRELKMHPMPARALALISLGCAAAAYVGFFTLTQGHALGRWWLAVLWWYAFSTGLWYFDRRPPTG